MKKSCKQQTLRSIYLCFSFLFIACLFSCKSDLDIVLPVNNSPQCCDTKEMLTHLEDRNKVKQEEIIGWLQRNFPGRYITALQMPKAEQNVIKGKHVVRIPVTKSAVMFFTKEDGVLCVYFYKCLDKAPGERLFTGNLLCYSFQKQILQEKIYDHTKTAFVGYFTISDNNIIVSKKEEALIKDGDSKSRFNKLWCLMTQGEWIDKTSIKTGLSYGTNGQVGIIACQSPQNIN